MEIGVEYDTGSGTDSFVLHLQCFATWLETVDGFELE
jgi:hypothetical protein